MLRLSPSTEENYPQRGPSRRSFPLWWKVCLAMSFLLAASGTGAQPYVADGGFGRPWEVTRLPGSTFVAVAFDGEQPLIYWSDRQGIWERRADPEAPAELVIEGRGIRQVSAATVHGEPALLWARRDLATGRTRHWLRWRGEEKLLLDDLQSYEMALAEAPAGPAVLIARREGAQTVLRLLAWGGGNTVLHRSDQSLVRYRAAFDGSGKGSVVWLEGFTDRNSLGFSAADWDAYLAEVDETGNAGRVIELGPVRYLGVESQTAIARVDGETQVLLPGPDGEVLFAASRSGAGAQATRPAVENPAVENPAVENPAVENRAVGNRAGENRAATDPGDSNADALNPVAIGTGTPVALSGSMAYWTEGASIRRRTVSPDEAPGSSTVTDSATNTVTNVAWSPATILRAELERVGDHHQLVWTGPTRGGEFKVFASDDTLPFRPGLRDRTAAAMGWSPWGFWEGAVGQVMGSLLAGMLVSMAVSPLLWLAAAMLVHSRWGEQPTRTGILLGAMFLIALLVAAEFVAQSTPLAGASLFGTTAQATVALMLAAAVTWWWRRRADTERLIGILSSSFLFAFVAVSTLAFLTFRTWLEAWSSLL